MRRARYICFEGLEGVGKTTQCDLLAVTLEKQGFKVLKTKEPGVALLPMTMALRGLMLDSRYESEITVIGRELISQVIRSIHMEKLVVPALFNYDYVVQDRGVLSGLSYGWACGNDLTWLKDMALRVTGAQKMYDIYDDVVFLSGNVATGLTRAQSSKQEFEAGDAMEARGLSFMDDVAAKMNSLLCEFPTRTVAIDGRNILQVHGDVLRVLNLS